MTYLEIAKQVLRLTGRSDRPSSTGLPCPDGLRIVYGAGSLWLVTTTKKDRPAHGVQEVEFVVELSTEESHLLRHFERQFKGGGMVGMRRRRTDALG
jgi:hypothetical protein